MLVLLFITIGMINWLNQKKHRKSIVPKIIFLFLLTLNLVACSKEEVKLKLDKEVVTTNDNGKASVKGETNIESELSIDGKKIKTKDGKFTHTVKLEDINDKNVTLVADLDGKELKKEVTIKASDNYIDYLEHEETKSVLKLAEQEPTQQNYDKAFTLVSSLSKEYEDINDRLAIIQNHIPIHEAVVLSEKEENRDTLEKAKLLIESATLNKEKLVQRLGKVEKNILEKEEIEQKSKLAREAVERAEASLSEEDYQQALTLIGEIPKGNNELAKRMEAVKIELEQKKEEQRQAEAARVQAEAEAKARAEENAQSAVGNQSTVLVTPTGEKYHSRKCGNGNYTETTLQDALNRGLAPCKKCFP